MGTDIAAKLRELEEQRRQAMLAGNAERAIQAILDKAAVLGPAEPRRCVRDHGCMIQPWHGADGKREVIATETPIV